MFRLCLIFSTDLRVGLIYLGNQKAVKSARKVDEHLECSAAFPGGSAFALILLICFFYCFFSVRIYIVGYVESFVVRLAKQNFSSRRPGMTFVVIA